MNFHQRLNKIEKSINWGEGCRMINIKYKNTPEDRQRAMDYIDSLDCKIKNKKGTKEPPPCGVFFPSSRLTSGRVGGLDSEIGKKRDRARRLFGVGIDIPLLDN